MEVLIPLIHKVLYSVAALLSLVYMVRGGRFWIGVGLFWIGGVLISFSSMIIGAEFILPRWPDLLKYFEEGHGFLALLGLGWLPGMILSGLGGGIRLLLKRLFPEFYASIAIK